MCIVHWVFNLQYKVRHVDVNIRMSIRNRATENARHEYTERQKVCGVISLNLNTGIARARSVSGNLVDFCKTVGYEKCHLKKLAIGEWPSGSLKVIVVANAISYESSLGCISFSCTVPEIIGSYLPKFLRGHFCPPPKKSASDSGRSGPQLIPWRFLGLTDILRNINLHITISVLITTNRRTKFEMNVLLHPLRSGAQNLELGHLALTTES